MKKTLAVTLDDDTGALSYELTGLEELIVTVEQYGAALHLNRSGCEAMARIFAKLAWGEYDTGFHIHIKEHFGDEPAPDVLTVVRR